MGASIGLALRRQLPKLRIAGWDSRKRNLQEARARGALTECAPSLERAVAQADCVVLGAPLEAIVRMLPTVFQHARPGSLVIDVGGLKVPVLAAVARCKRQRSDVAFVGGHPLAGRESSGAQFAAAELFSERPFVLTPLPHDARHAAALQRAKAFVRLLGARPVVMGARAHDRLIAITSALPQLVATATALAVRDAAGGRSTKLAGPGYEGVSRLAMSPFTSWKAPLFENARNVRRALAVFEVRVRQLRRFIENEDTPALRRLFAQAASARRATSPN